MCANNRTENINVYNIICDSIGITPLANNGTLRLPLKPVGLHSDEDAPQDEMPEDPPISSSTPSPSPSSAPNAALVASSAVQTSATVATPTSSTSPTPTVVGNWWEWLTHKAENAEAWVDEFMKDHFTGDPIDIGKNQQGQQQKGH